LECHQNYIISANYQKYCKECIRDVHLNNLKKYYKNNTHKWFIYAKWYRETGRGKEYHKQYARFRRITEKLLVQQFTNEEWKEKLNRTNGICPKCNVYVGIDKLELDHIFPISKAEKGRIYTIDDIQPLCRKCNARKCNKL
jgi:5-methylcytosine-specific restriction endonuclease McrA